MTRWICIRWTSTSLTTLGGYSLGVAPASRFDTASETYLPTTAF